MAVDLKAWAAAHKTQLAIGGAGTAGAAALLLKKKSAAAATTTAGTTSTTNPAGTTYGTGDPYNGAQDVYSSIEPQLENLQQEISNLGTGTPATGATNTGSPTTTGAGTTTPPPPPPPTNTSPPPPPAQTQTWTAVPPPPPNGYSIGQQVAPGETIVAQTLDAAKNGWYDLTSLGGVYTSGGATLSPTYGGSYLGYANTLSPAQRAAENPGGPGTGNGNFSNGKITSTPSGGYSIVDDTGSVYTF